MLWTGSGQTAHCEYESQHNHSHCRIHIEGLHILIWLNHTWLMAQVLRYIRPNMMIVDVAIVARIVNTPINAPSTLCVGSTTSPYRERSIRDQK